MMSRLTRLAGFAAGLLLLHGGAVTAMAIVVNANPACHTQACILALGFGFGFIIMGGGMVVWAILGGEN